MKSVAALLTLALGALALPLFLEPANAGPRSRMLIDDFASKEGISALGTRWRGFTDRVMGGISDAAVTREVIEGRACVRLRGTVSLENNGGFIQVALPLSGRGQAYDAGKFKGIRFWARGNGERYYLHLRNADTRLPWQYYYASFPTGKQWKLVEIPFSAFEPAALSGALDVRTLNSIGIVGAKKAFTADVAVAELAFYR